MIDSGPWGVTSEYNNKLRVVEECVAFNKTAKIFYRDVDGELTERVIEPHVLVLKQGIWYVYAFCRLRGDFRLFKVGRIERVIVLDECFERRPTDGLKEVFSYRLDAPESAYVTLWISPSAMAEAEEWLGVEAVNRVENGGHASVKLPVDNGLISKILSFGKGVKVLSPESLKKRIESIATEIAEQYK